MKTPPKRVNKHLYSPVPIFVDGVEEYQDHVESAQERRRDRRVHADILVDVVDALWVGHCNHLCNQTGITM